MLSRRQTVIDMYKKGYSIKFIVNSLYKTMNKSYYDDFFNKHILDNKKYYDIDYCRKMVQSTILDFIKKKGQCSL